MGMASSDDEQAIMEQYALEQWAKERPEAPGSYDYPDVSEDERAHYQHNLKQWAARKPRTRNPYGDR